MLLQPETSLWSQLLWVSADLLQFKGSFESEISAGQCLRPAWNHCSATARFPDLAAGADDGGVGHHLGTVPQNRGSTQATAMTAIPGRN